MKEDHNHIEDYEIRVIKGTQKSQAPTQPIDRDSDAEPAPKPRIKKWYWISISLIVVAMLALALYTYDGDRSQMQPTDRVALAQDTPTDIDITYATATQAPKSSGYTTITDTIINNEALKIFVPHGATPRLMIGPQCADDTTAVLMFQAADVRGDNSQINCAFVKDGALVARGEAKAGYCAIIEGEPQIGVERYTPLMEKAIETGGDFFRQYPLVTGGVPVSNTLKSKSLRRALVSKAGEIQVVASSSRLSLDEFAAILADYGADQAIYLVGATAYGMGHLQSGEIFRMGDKKDWTNVNYIVWK